MSGSGCRLKLGLLPLKERPPKVLSIAVTDKMIKILSLSLAILPCPSSYLHCPSFLSTLPESPYRSIYLFISAMASRSIPYGSSVSLQRSHSFLLQTGRLFTKCAFLVILHLEDISAAYPWKTTSWPASHTDLEGDRSLQRDGFIWYPGSSASSVQNAAHVTLSVSLVKSEEE